MSRRPLTVGIGVIALAAAVFLLQFTAAVLIPLVVSLLLFAGVMNLVPYFGPLLVTTVLAAVGLLQFGTVGGAVVVGGIALTITSLEGDARAV